MKLLKWLREIGVAPPETDGSISRLMSARGIAIQPEWRSQWTADACGIHETRRHVGRSVEGFHPGIEVCYRAGVGRIEWGNAQATPEMACAESAQLETDCRARIPQCIHGQAESPASGCCLYSTADAGVALALLELHEIVAMIESDPAENWPRCHPDFERALAALSQSITALWVRQGQAVERGACATGNAAGK